MCKYGKGTSRDNVKIKTIDELKENNIPVINGKKEEIIKYVK